VLYISSERFTTEFVQSIQHNRVSEFSLFYRQIDLLIVDDIQFFGGKEKTQEEFFHVFNALHQSGKQIILSADRPPRDIEGIEERLLSRFQWGLSADVQPPELETRIAILQRKAEDDGIELDSDIVEFIAHNIKSNIRELEGAMIRLLAHATLHDREIDLPLAREVLRDLIKESRVHLSIEEIQRITCEYFGIADDLVARRLESARSCRRGRLRCTSARSLPSTRSRPSAPFRRTGSLDCDSRHSERGEPPETDPSFEETLTEIRRKIELRSR
jgi:chromosomal replication initiator protein